MPIIQTYANQQNSLKTAVKRQISCAINRTPTATAGTPQGILHFNIVQWHNGEASQRHSANALTHCLGDVPTRASCTANHHSIIKIICKNMLTNINHSSTIKTVQR